MKNLYWLDFGYENKMVAIVFDEVDSKWHFIDFEKENVRYKDYSSPEEAIESLNHYIESGIIKHCVQIPDTCQKYI